MHFQLIEKEKRSMVGLWRGLWLAAVMGTLLSLLNSMSYGWAVLPGVALVIAAGFLPRRQQGVVGLAIFAICALWIILRYKPILNGLGFLANRLLALSEESQGYYYVFFTVSGEAPAESLFFLTCVISAFCIWLGGCVNLLLTLALAVVIAYFGVVPSIVWLCILLIAAFANALPKRGRWLPAILIAVFVSVTAFSIKTVAPEPNLQIANLINKFWEFFVPSTQEIELPPTEPTEMELPPQTEEPTEPEEPSEPETDYTLPEDYTIPDDYTFPEDYTIPEFVETPEVPETIEVTDPTEVPPTDSVVLGPEEGGTRKYNKAWRSHLMSITIACLLAVLALAVWFLWVTRKRKRNRESMFVKDNAEAIRNIYLYAKRWRKLNPSAEEIPPEVEAIWLEAAYSEHKMTDEQRKVMRSFMRKTALTTWHTLNWWKRFVVYWHYAL